MLFGSAERRSNCEDNRHRRGVEYASRIRATGATEPLVFTDHGTPTAVILTLVNTDMETAALSTNPEFIALIERSRACAKAEGGLSAAEMRRRVLPAT